MVNIHEKWTCFEKRKLARLLTVYPLDAYDRIAAKFSDKTAEEVELFIKKMMHSTKIHMILNKKKFLPYPQQETKAPLEAWLDVSKCLVREEQFDYSSCLSKVMSFISSFEDFPEGDIDGHRQPDYRLIYKFLANALDDTKHEEVELGSLESAVVLDLIHGLMEVTSENDLEVQANVMRWKYQLMNERDHLGHPLPELLSKASENDFKDFIELEDKSFQEKRTRDLANRDRISLAQSAKQVYEETLTKPGMADAGTSTSEKSSNEKNDALRYIEDKSKKPVKIVTRYIYEADYQLTKKKTDPTAYINSEVFHNKPGRKSVTSKENDSTLVTEIVHVIPPKNATIVNMKPRFKKPTVRDDGKWFGLNAKEKEEDDPVSNEEGSSIEITTNNGESSAIKNISIESLQAFSKRRQEQEDAQQEAIHQSRKRKYETISKKKDGKRAVKKPKMYSLNPFCMPVSLLDLDS